MMSESPSGPRSPHIPLMITSLRDILAPVPSACLVALGIEGNSDYDGETPVLLVTEEERDAFRDLPGNSHVPKIGGMLVRHADTAAEWAAVTRTIVLPVPLLVVRQQGPERTVMSTVHEVSHLLHPELTGTRWERMAEHDALGQSWVAYIHSSGECVAHLDGMIALRWAFPAATMDLVLTNGEIDSKDAFQRELWKGIDHFRPPLSSRAKSGIMCEALLAARKAAWPEGDFPSWMEAEFWRILGKVREM